MKQEKHKNMHMIYSICLLEILAHRFVKGRKESRDIQVFVFLFSCIVPGCVTSMGFLLELLF